MLHYWASQKDKHLTQQDRSLTWTAYARITTLLESEGNPAQQ